MDVLILDSRYPLLSHNKDGSVIAMLHSVVHVIEVKTSVGKRDISAVLKGAAKVFALSTSVFPKHLHGAIGIVAIGYGSSIRLSTIEAHFFDRAYQVRECDLLLLRVRPGLGRQKSDPGPQLLAWSYIGSRTVRDDQNTLSGCV
jgi:hypothetical protein